MCFLKKHNNRKPNFGPGILEKNEEDVTKWNSQSGSSPEEFPSRGFVAPSKKHDLDAELIYHTHKNSQIVDFSANSFLSS